MTTWESRRAVSQRENNPEQMTGIPLGIKREDGGTEHRKKLVGKIVNHFKNQFRDWKNKIDKIGADCLPFASRQYKGSKA